jgi:hypothetical protein
MTLTPPEPPARMLVLDAEHVARRLKLPVPLDPGPRFTIEEAIWDAQADIEAYLKQPIVPTTYVESGLIAYPDGWHLSHTRIIGILSIEPEMYADEPTVPTGGFTVTYLAGLDAANDPDLDPIRREVMRRVMESPEVIRVWQAAQGDASKRIKSQSVEGQSVGYEFLTPTGTERDAKAVSPEDRLKRLDRWRLRGVYQRRGVAVPNGGLPTRRDFYL